MKMELLVIFLFHWEEICILKHMPDLWNNLGRNGRSWLSAFACNVNRQNRQVNNDIHTTRQKRAANNFPKPTKTCALSWHFLQGVKAPN